MGTESPRPILLKVYLLIEMRRRSPPARRSTDAQLDCPCADAVRHAPPAVTLVRRIPLLFLPLWRGGQNYSPRKNGVETKK